MIDYTISKIGDNIILTLPTTKTTYYNTYNNRTYTNCSNGITLKKTLITHSYLENIKIGAEDITHATQEDITMQFRTTTGNVININCGENSTELEENVNEGITATDFYLDAVGGKQNKSLIIDYINTVLIDVYTNKNVLDELCSDEDVVANPCPDCPDCPDCPECSDMWNTLFNTLLAEEWLRDTSIGLSNHDENGFDAYCYAKDTSANNATTTWTMDGETIAEKGIPWDRTEPVQLTIADGNENTVTVDVPVQMLWQSTQFDFDFAGYRTYQQYINPTTEEAETTE